ncbi:EboA domain-containing protein [Gilvimarinus sp. SDUM040013]|uniref:EboA domain-containing protein n=1 Tax=Gilvimarinus gilvus TaxID=3058038 RepID=A0ABU4S1Y6_9GAMM|nr:EboA domain-containing protein [Gilvimarinus sp. SDUM040013]MDO3385867.1 EboA domain-containing protein [Gilvimarinus sp. SDUM040013]MDX6851160.1 EboA domain-containing protein [Gilvimarinus sp. SDUM040013]
MSQSITNTLETLLAPRLADTALAFWQKSRDELTAGVSTHRFAALIALASRHAKRTPLELSPEEIDAIAELGVSIDMRGWNLLELLRVGLITARCDLNEVSFAEDFEAQFVYADEGETCALYRALALLPAGERFVWRAGEGCRTNMNNVFATIALDTPYPVQHFDDTAWNQLVMKSLFLELPLWRVLGLDNRRSQDLTRMVLDFAEERESAGRAINNGLWLCLGPHDNERTSALALRAWAAANSGQHAAIVLGLARCNLVAVAEQLGADSIDTSVTSALQAAQNGQTDNIHFAQLTADNSETQA